MKQEEPSRSEVVLAQLAEGMAWFEFVETWGFEPSDAPFASLSSAFSRVHKKQTFSPCFAKIGGIRNAPQPWAKTSPALKKIEQLTVRKVAGDGRCMFRALVLGMAANKGASLNYYEEEQEADQLRLAVMDAICTSDMRTRKYEEALIAITVEESLARYCERIPSPSFWGGESELLVLSRMCSQPILVYIPESEVFRSKLFNNESVVTGNMKERAYGFHYCGCQQFEAKREGRAGGGYVKIAEYGSEFRSSKQGKKGRKPVRLLYSSSNHYDLLELTKL